LNQLSLTLLALSQITLAVTILRSRHFATMSRISPAVLSIMGHLHKNNRATTPRATKRRLWSLARDNTSHTRHTQREIKQGLTTFISPKTTLQLTLTLTALTYVLTSSTVYMLLTAVLTPAILVIGSVCLRELHIKALSRRLNLHQPLLFENLTQVLSEGRSFDVALKAATENSGFEFYHIFGRGLSEPIPYEDQREYLITAANVFSLPRLRLLLEVTRDRRISSEIPQIVNAVREAVSEDIHRDTLKLVEHRSQLVWIPVSIAVLIPGTMLLLIPLFNTLKTLANI
jgi:histone H3/H4